uniref:Uncharacterized protein n=1 Tax=Oryza nivara TaxID=4536 RepID=A0A0E0GPX7_ORYNI
MAGTAATRAQLRPAMVVPWLKERGNRKNGTTSARRSWWRKGLACEAPVREIGRWHQWPDMGEKERELEQLGLCREEEGTSSEIEKDILWTMGIFRWRSKGKRSKGRYLMEDKTGFGGSMRWLSGN